MKNTLVALTLAFITSVSCGTQHPDTSSDVSAGRQGKRIIEINRAQNVLALKESNGSVVPGFAKIVIASGRDSHPTPAGKFSVTFIKNCPGFALGANRDEFRILDCSSNQSPLGAGWIQFSGPIFQDGAVTSLNFKGQLALQGTNAPQLLTSSNPAFRAITGGNVRMLNSDISKLMQQVRTGDDVVIK